MTNRVGTLSHFALDDRGTWTHSQIDTALTTLGDSTKLVRTVGDQSISGVKTFLTAPVYAGLFTANGQLVNKGYVDSRTAMGVHWVAQVNSFFDFSSGNPSPLYDYDRYISITTTGAFTANYVYTWTASTSSWIAGAPVEGDALYVTSDTSPSFPNQDIVFNGSIWVNIGSTVNHQSLIGAGTITHATIDSYLNQAVKTTSEPQFLRLGLGQAASTSACSLCVRGYCAGGGQIRIESYGDNQICGGLNLSEDGILTLSTAQEGTGLKKQQIWLGGSATGNTSSTVIIPCTGASTSTTNGALQVAGGVGIGGAVNCATTTVTNWAYMNRTTTGGLRGGVNDFRPMSSTNYMDLMHPSLFSTFVITGWPTTGSPMVRQRHISISSIADNHSPGAWGLYFDTVSYNRDNGFDSRGVEIISMYDAFATMRPVLALRTATGVAFQHSGIADADADTKAYLSIVPGSTTGVAYGTITYVQNATNNANAYLRFGNTLDASSPTAGGAVFDGGVAIAQKLYVGGTVNIAHNFDSIPNNGFIVYNSGMTSTSDMTLLLGGHDGANFNNIQFGYHYATAGSDNNYGFICLSGYAATYAHKFARTSLSVPGQMIVFYGDDSSKRTNLSVDSTGNSSLTTSGGTHSFSSGTIVKILNTTTSSSTTTGSIVASGGVGVAENLNVGARVTAATMTCSTAPSANTDVVRLADLSGLAVVHEDTIDMAMSGTGISFPGYTVKVVRVLDMVTMMFHGETRTSTESGNAFASGMNVIPVNYRPYSQVLVPAMITYSGAFVQCIVQLDTNLMGIRFSCTNPQWTGTVAIAIQTFSITYQASSAWV